MFIEIFLFYISIINISVKHGFTANIRYGRSSNFDQSVYLGDGVGNTLTHRTVLVQIIIQTRTFSLSIISSIYVSKLVSHKKYINKNERERHLPGCCQKTSLESAVMMKEDKMCSFQPALWPSSAEEEDWPQC